MAIYTVFRSSSDVFFRTFCDQKEKKEILKWTLNFGFWFLCLFQDTFPPTQIQNCIKILKSKLCFKLKNETSSEFHQKLMLNRP